MTVEPKRLKTTTDKENVAVPKNIKSAVKPEEKSKKVIPASAKKVSAKKSAQHHADESLPIMSMKVIQLRNELRKRNLDTTGLKKDLQRRLMEHVQAIEIKKRPESKSVIKSAVKAKALAAASSARKDRDGDVRMEESKTSDGDGSRRGSSNMDVDEDETARRTKGVEAAKETTVAKSFLKSTAELFSPQKIASKMHSSKKNDQIAVDLTSSVTNETNQKPSAPQSGRKSLTDGLKKTASAIFSSASPARKVPVTQAAKSPYTKASAVIAKSVVKPKEEAPVQATQSE